MNECYIQRFLRVQKSNAGVLLWKSGLVHFMKNLHTSTAFLHTRI